MTLSRYFPSHPQCFTLYSQWLWKDPVLPRGMKPQLHEDQTSKPNLTFLFLSEGQLSARMRCTRLRVGHRAAVSLRVDMWPGGTNSTVMSWIHNLIKNRALNGHSVQGTGRDARGLLSTWKENMHTGKLTCSRRNLLQGSVSDLESKSSEKGISSRNRILSSHVASKGMERRREPWKITTEVGRRDWTA